MEYYAKSPTNVMPEKKREELLDKVNGLIYELRNELSEKEIQILEGYVKDLQSEHKEEHKTLEKHLDETVKCALNFFEFYGDYFTEKEKKLILKACMEHDTGKANYVFQTKVNPDLKPVKKEQIPHGFLSAMCMNKIKFLNDNPDCTKNDFAVLLTSVYFHHNRKDNYNQEEFEAYCNKYYLDYVREYKNDQSISLRKSNHSNLLFSNDISKNYMSISEDVWCEYMIVKGMLNKFDWTVSAGYDISEMTSDRNERLLCKEIEENIAGQLRPAQKFMSENRDRNVVITAPTGSGKTEAALLWLDGEKGFYTLPLKVSSNAIYKRIKEKYKFKNTALLHSDSMGTYIEESEGDYDTGYKNYEQAKLLSFPLTVCTVDQLFKFVYKALGTEIFAATLKYSRVIIDEIQSYSPNIVAALLYGLGEVKQMGGKFAIITATFPPVLNFFMQKCGLIESKDYIYKDFSDTADIARHRIKVVDGCFDRDVLIEDSYKRKVLVICNTVSKAQKLYQDIISECDNAGLLHSRFIRKHRDILEDDIMMFSEDKDAKGIWITTQIVEASLDIDFDVLYTEMCTADSLLQRMGRCNRAGKKETNEPNIIIYTGNTITRGKVEGIYDKDIYLRSVDCLRKYDGMLLSESDKKVYIDEVYDIEKIKNTEYYNQIDRSIAKFSTINPLEYDSKDADGDFRNMDSITVIPDRIYNDNREFIDVIAETINTPGVHSGVRKILKSKLESITLNLNIRNKHCYPNGVDYDTIKKSLDIHRANLKYDFDETKGRGIGMLLDVLEDEVFFV